MPRSILLGLDGTEQSAGAVELGLRWARRHDALLVGIGVIDEPSIRSAEPVPMGATYFKEHRDQRLLAQARREVESRLSAFAARCAAEGVACKLLEEVGMPGEQIMLEAQRFDMILLGQKSEFRFWWNEHGRTLHEVVRSSPRPVVAVPTDPPQGDSVLIAYDGSLQSARTLQAFVGVGLHQSTTVHILTVGEDSVEAAKCANRAADYLGRHGVDPKVHVQESSAAPAPLIVSAARELQAELVVMGAYGKPSLREFFFGTVTRNILDASPVPLFLCH